MKSKGREPHPFGEGHCKLQKKINSKTQFILDDFFFALFQSQKYISHFNSNIQTDICSWVQFGIDYNIEIREKCVFFFVVIAKP